MTSTMTTEANVATYEIGVTDWKGTMHGRETTAGRRPRVSYITTRKTRHTGTPRATGLSAEH